MCNSRLGSRAYLRQWTFLSIWRVHLVAPVHTTKAHYHPNNPISNLVVNEFFFPNTLLLGETLWLQCFFSKCCIRTPSLVPFLCGEQRQQWNSEPLQGQSSSLHHVNVSGHTEIAWNDQNMGSTLYVITTKQRK